MNAGTLLRLVTSWQFLVVCLFVILLLPLVVALASRSARRIPRLRPFPRRKGTPRPPRRRKEEAAEGAEEAREEQ